MNAETWTGPMEEEGAILTACRMQSTFAPAAAALLASAQSAVPARCTLGTAIAPSIGAGCPAALWARRWPKVVSFTLLLQFA
ncbi:hypothetical protein ACCAA_270009 [Candidatus Accumulibacter aalborgensis]|uniref:Uncharacterized protein n=1 Tax=Candidatus Accumulibacter aalborgensis TaxID=1860102 RepID=A0A1A8XKQ2_9PROT|nr:hypothetical protein ACCAA_270009 [Candidatus Accumulibacter aalborgensis]